MTTLKITFYKNIKSVLVLVNHNFLILGGKVGGGWCEFNVWTEFFFTKTLMMMMIMKMNVMISRMSFLILNKYWEYHEIIEYLKMYS
jgi:hypothetical protein